MVLQENMSRRKPALSTGSASSRCVGRRSRPGGCGRGKLVGERTDELWPQEQFDVDHPCFPVDTPNSPTTKTITGSTGKVHHIVFHSLIIVQLELTLRLFLVTICSKTTANGLSYVVSIDYKNIVWCTFG